MRRVALACVGLLAGTATALAQAPDAYVLDNGLRVALRPVPKAEQVAVVVVFGVGGDHDPADRSGLAHLVEHLYVTAAAGTTAARTAEAYQAAYEAGWNAQTGPRHTILGVVAPAARLEAELADAAARMGDLRPDAADLAREVPRVVEELANMYERMPGLVARNLARAAVRGVPGGGRHGGTPEAVAVCTLDEATTWWRRFYKPGNAVLAVAGGFDAAAAKAAIARLFGPLPKGESPAAPAALPAPTPGTTTVPIADAKSGGIVCAWRVPPPGDPAFPPVAVCLARIWARQAGAARKEGVSFSYAPLDDPEVAYAMAPLKPDETPDASVARVQAWVDAGLAAALGPGEALVTRQQFGLMLGIAPVSSLQLKQNPYGAALPLAVGPILGVDGAAIGRAVDGLGAPALAAARERFAAACRGAVVVVEPK